MDRTMAQAVLDRLADRGVHYLFGLPGSTEGALLDALSRRDGCPQFVLCLHEGVAAAMADGYARVSGRPGVCVLHTTVGGGNAVSQLYNSRTDNVPVLCIIGHKDSSLYNSGGFCSTGYLPNWFVGCAKDATQVFRADDVVDDVERQLLRAVASPPGPAVVVVPQDFWEHRAACSRAQPASGMEMVPRAGRPDASQLQVVHERLRAAQRGVLLAGDWVYREDAVDLAVQFAHTYGLVIVGEPRRSASRRGRLGESALYLGELEDCAEQLAAADVVFAAGARTFVEFESAAATPVVDPTVLILVHPSPGELLARTVASMSLIASVGSTFEAALQLAGQDASPQPPPSAAGAASAPSDVRVDGAALTARTVGEVLDSCLAADTIVMDEAVTSSRPLVRQLRLRDRREYHRNTGGALGWGIPAAVGAQLASPERPVVCLLGDGAAMFGLQGLWTAARLRTPVLFLVLNNGGYRSVQGHVGRYRDGVPGPPVPGTEFDVVPIDFAALSRSLGVPGARVDTADSLRDAVQQWLAGDGPLLLECPVPPVS